MKITVMFSPRLAACRISAEPMAVALVVDHDAAGQAARHSGGHGWRAPVGGGDIAHIEIVVGKHAATDRANQNRPVLNAQLIDGPRQHLVYLAVSAAGAKMRLML
jgi:hypothetical protein